MTRIYLGPTLEIKLAKQILAGDYQPPVKRGDIGQAIAEGVKRILIIDGVFFNTLSVSVVEIREAIHYGVEVWGASSMGALRAVEAGPIGMRGWGEVYRQYLEGDIDNDDAVALTFDENYVSISEPLVNIFSALRFMIQINIITPSEEQELRRISEETYFPDRILSIVLRKSSLDSERSKRILNLLLQTRTYWDIKRKDAITLLAKIAYEG